MARPLPTIGCVHGILVAATGPSSSARSGRDPARPPAGGVWICQPHHFPAVAAKVEYELRRLDAARRAYSRDTMTSSLRMVKDWPRSPECSPCGRPVPAGYGQSQLVTVPNF